MSLALLIFFVPEKRQSRNETNFEKVSFVKVQHYLILQEHYFNEISNLLILFEERDNFNN